MNYEDKDISYYANIRHDLLTLINSNATNLRVLEIGAAYGETLYYLKSTGIAQEAVGVDIFEDKKHPEKYKPLDRFIFGNIEVLDFHEFENYFDLILLPDVIEHLVEPKHVLEKVNRYLKAGGTALVSMPNVRHYSTFKRIFLKGDFKYDESGLFDYTHMRFYCKKNMVGLFAKSGFKVTTLKSAISIYKGRSMAKIFNRLTFGIFEEFLSLQFFFTANKQ
ncbi:class I SAM-dependent methyltransferase [Flavobacterium sp. RHBU_24]|uniref:class I SAM-dependent methyltransferase n=1 Tax=Flavobacterium sp. RHBU_24 TaxID=3391185 RepID=UPI003984D18A